MNENKWFIQKWKGWCLLTLIWGTVFQTSCVRSISVGLVCLQKLVGGSLGWIFLFSPCLGPLSQIELLFCNTKTVLVDFGVFDRNITAFHQVRYPFPSLLGWTLFICLLREVFFFRSFTKCCPIIYAGLSSLNTHEILLTRLTVFDRSTFAIGILNVLTFLSWFRRLRFADLALDGCFSLLLFSSDTWSNRDH